jgi:hypothetical protein
MKEIGALDHRCFNCIGYAPYPDRPGLGGCTRRKVGYALMHADGDQCGKFKLKPAQPV